MILILLLTAVRPTAPFLAEKTALPTSPPSVMAVTMTTSGRREIKRRNPKRVINLMSTLS
jgi:hypothetical protein